MNRFYKDEIPKYIEYLILKNKIIEFIKNIKTLIITKDK
jgi:hypothetical protein